jgi:hypothetical protein
LASVEPEHAQPKRRGLRIAGAAAGAFVALGIVGSFLPDDNETMLVNAREAAPTSAAPTTSAPAVAKAPSAATSAKGTVAALAGGAGKPAARTETTSAKATTTRTTTKPVTTTKAARATKPAVKTATTKPADTTTRATKTTATAPAARDFANCSELNGEYPHGVGRPGAVDQTSGTPVTSFLVDSALYAANSESDRDGDGIACEKR